MTAILLQMAKLFRLLWINRVARIQDVACLVYVALVALHASFAKIIYVMICLAMLVVKKKYHPVVVLNLEKWGSSHVPISAFVLNPFVARRYPYLRHVLQLCVRMA